MKTLTTLFALAILCAAASAQTIKSLGYDTASGEVVANTGTNVLTFTNNVYVKGSVRILDGTNLAFEFPNDAQADFRYSIGFGGPNAEAQKGITRTNLGLGTAATNAASAFQPASAALTNLAANDAANLTNFPALLLRTNGSAAELTNFPTLNQNTTGTASNVTGVVAIANGGTGATNEAVARTNLGIPLPALTNTSNADMLSALGAAQTIFTVKTNDQTIIDETNATTITDLTFATEPGARYVVTFYPIIEGVTILQMNETNATIYGQWNGLGTGFASATELTTGRTFSVSGSDTRGALQVFYVEGGTNAGSISATLRGADTNTTNTIKAGSFLRADKMP
jgi:hypothetical protein